MDPSTPILIVCQDGNIRSVSFGRILKLERGYYNVLTAGIKKVKPETFRMLANWAQKIFVPTEQEIFDQIPSEYKNKSTHIDIGIDRWGNPIDPELEDILRDAADDLGL